MVELKKTTKEAKHYHIVYLGDDGRSICSGRIGKGPAHKHEIYYNTISYPDEMGMGLVKEEPMWEVEEVNDHKHALIPYTTEITEKKKDDKTLVAENNELFTDDVEGKSRKEGKESVEMYTGENQWPKSIKQKLEANDRAALTINEIEPKIDLLSGYQRRNRFDYKYLPTEEGDARIADILTLLVKNICSQNDFEFEETEAFIDQCVQGRGLINVRVDYSDDIRGKIVLEHYEWDEVKFGPHKKTDLSDLEWLIKEKWYSIGKLKQTWSDKVDDIDKEIELAKGESEITNLDTTYDDTNEDNTSNVAKPYINKELLNVQKKEFRVLERWSKEYKQVFIIANILDDFYYNAEGWTKKDINAVKDFPGFTIIPRVKTEMRVVQTASNILLSNEKPDLAVQDFYIVPFYAKKRKNFFWGKVQGMKDPQREANKRISQTADILNTTAGRGWFTDGRTFFSPADEANFLEKSSQPNQVFKLNDVNKPPVKIEGTTFPHELTNMSMMMSDKAKEISNVNPALSGIEDSKAESGIALFRKKEQGLIGNEFLFDNFKRGRKKIGKMLPYLITQVYTPERIIRLLEHKNTKEMSQGKAPIQVGGKPLPQQSPDELIKLLEEELFNNENLMNYDVEVAESPFTASTRQANFMIWMEMAQRGVKGISFPFLLRLSDLPEKQLALSEYQQEMASEQQKEQGKQQTEIAKTQIAAQAKQNKGQ